MSTTNTTPPSIKTLGVFIVTHLTPGFRHGGMMEHVMFDYFTKTVIHNYQTLDSGLNPDEVVVHIMDTGSDDPRFEPWLYKAANKNLVRVYTPNKCGFCASLKYCMHEDPSYMDQFKYFLFHIDDGVEPIENGWAKDLIDQYESHDNMGIMGRFLDTIRLGPMGLIDHRNVCPHVAEMWGITEVETIPHLHGDWWLMNQETLKELSKEWFNPVESQDAMEYQIKWEEEDFRKLAKLSDNRRTLDNVHIGREVDNSLRITRLLKKNLAEYTGHKFLAKQLHHRV
jgi:hypothetical protein